MKDLNEMREKSVSELREEITRLRKEQFNNRLRKATDNLKQTHLLRQTRRDIARVNTVIREKAGS